MSTFTVYRIDSASLFRDHHAIFVETHENGEGTGHLYQVAGNIQQGMAFEDRLEDRPESSLSFASKVKIGTVSRHNNPCIKGVCEGVPVPKKQFDGPKRLYPNEPIRRCQEWTAEAIQALVDAQILRPLEADATSGLSSPSA
ncbi:MAG: hypothetical protein M1819_007088 [Sarea resinae]|nr:MAG: hypothetical protein M1819_007088 [Sarea resinae]